MIYLDNAATSWPKPESVYRTADDFLRTKGGNPGRGSHSMAVAARDVVEETRLLLSRLFNANKDHVFFTLNCTDALNLGLKGFLQNGDHVITDSLSHNSIVRPLKKLRNQGIKVTQLSPSVDSGVVSPRDIEQAIVSKTKLILITHASNVTGTIQPIHEYGAIARRYGVWFMVDAAQTAGKYSIDVQESNIDLLAFSGHKGLLGPPGTGALIISERVMLDTLREGGTGSFSEDDEQPSTLPDKFESGTQNGVGIAGLGAGIKFIQKERLEKIRNHEEILTEKLIEGLRQIPKLTLYTAKNGNEQAPVISFNLNGFDPGEIGTILDQSFDIKVRTGLHCAPVAHRTIGTFPKGTVRLSPGYFNTLEDIRLTVEAMRKIASSGH